MKGSLFTLQPVGSVWHTGGEAAPRGAPCTLLLLCQQPQASPLAALGILQG